MAFRFTWFLCLVCLLVLADVSVCHAFQYHSDKYGFNLTLPDDWVQIPDTEVRKMIAARTKPGAKLPFTIDTAFQPQNQDWFALPNIIVMVQDYHDAGYASQPNDDQCLEIVKALAGRKGVRPISPVLSDDVRAQLSSIALDSVTYDAANRRIDLPAIQTLATGEKIQSLMAGHFGRSSLVQITFTVNEDGWAKNAPIVLPIMNSLSFDPDKKYDSTLNAKNNTGIKSFLWSHSTDLVAIGVIFCGFLVVTRIIKNKSKPTMPK